MTQATLVLPEPIAATLANLARNPLETAGVILAGVERTDASLRLLAAQLYEIPDNGYDIREADRLLIPSGAYVGALATGADLNLTAIFFHTHPSNVAAPKPSHWDDKVDDELLDTFRVRTGSNIYTSIVMSPADQWFTFTGRGTDGDQNFAVSRIIVVGDRIALLRPYEVDRSHLDPELFDRNIRAFGSGIQHALADLRFGIVGCGGTGSAVAEQLVRLGARSITLVDPDVLAESNVTRVYGSTSQEVGKPKVGVLAAHLKRIAADADLRVVNGSVLEECAARTLTACDVIFGCTDDNAGRLILSRIAAYYLIPLFDCGVLISSSHERIESIFGRVTTQTPGAACLVCRNRIDLAQAAAEQLPEKERAELQREGYAPELGAIEPAVVTFTTAVAAQAITELLDRLVRFGPEPVPTEVLLRLHDRELSANRAEPIPGHFCHPDGGALGVGDRDPFLGQLWKA